MPVAALKRRWKVRSSSPPGLAISVTLVDRPGARLQPMLHLQDRLIAMRQLRRKAA
jgi:hypothetical protein